MQWAPDKNNAALSGKKVETGSTYTNYTRAYSYSLTMYHK